MTGPGDARSRAARDRWLPAGALLAAALLALATGVATVRAPPEASRDEAPSWRAWRIAPAHPAAAADAALAALRPALPPGERVGYLTRYGMAELIAREPDVQRFYAAQYALAPAVLKPIFLPECEARGEWACGVGRMRLLLATEDVAGRAAALGFEPTASAGGLTLLRRSAP